jgi:hypothetical protein
MICTEIFSTISCILPFLKKDQQRNIPNNEKEYQQNKINYFSNLV